MTWQEIWNNYINLSPGILQIALRLLCAMVVGALIGIEREYTHRPAGLRTHILVALGACVVSITGEMLFTHYQVFGATPDPARLSAQVVTGVGFLGAGTIMKEGVNVKGLTTAASVWAVACLGIAAGFGYYALSLLGMIFTLLTLTVFESLQRSLLRSHSAEEQYIVAADNVAKALDRINTAAKDPKISITDLRVEQADDGYCITFRALFVGRHNVKHRNAFVAALAATDGVRSVADATEVKV